MFCDFELKPIRCCFHSSSSILFIFIFLSRFINANYYNGTKFRISPFQVIFPPPPSFKMPWNHLTTAAVYCRQTYCSNERTKSIGYNWKLNFAQIETLPQRRGNFFIELKIRIFFYESWEITIFSDESKKKKKDANSKGRTKAIEFGGTADDDVKNSYQSSFSTLTEYLLPSQVKCYRIKKLVRNGRLMTLLLKVPFWMCGPRRKNFF